MPDMENQEKKAQRLRKLIDIPKPILLELKKLALESNKSLKEYIQDIIIDEAERSRTTRQNGSGHEATKDDR
jgi:hypothetical protein